MVTPTLLILAAGMGSRYGGPKFIEPVGPSGEIVADYSIHDAHRAGFGRILFVIRTDMEESFKEFAGAHFGKRVPIEYVYQDLHKLPRGFKVPPGRTRPWGTTHAILMAEKAIHEPFAVINVNDFYGAQSYCLLARHLQSGTSSYAMAGYVLRNTLSEFGAVARAVCQVTEGGFLKDVVELKSIERSGGRAKSFDGHGNETNLTGDEVVATNMWGFMPDVFPLLREHFEKFLQAHGEDQQAECFIPETVNEILKAEQARVKVLHCEDSWFGITYPEDHTRAVATIRRLVEGGYYPRHLRLGA